uniref:Uncharacterized protein n=1 Tax=Brassica campestris TaxID=3711 RepID=M4ER15_BRACM
MNSSEYIEEFPRKFLGNTKFGFLGISSEYTDGIPRKIHSVYDEVSQLQTDDDDSTASTNLSRVRINEIVESSVPKKKGRLVGLGRRSRSAAPSSAPPAYVDPEVLTAQLKDKDDRISALETQMAAQQAGYETQKRLNEQMMEMMKRMYPNEVFPNIPDQLGESSSEFSEGLKFLGIFRGKKVPRNFSRDKSFSEFSDKHSEENFVETSDRNFRGLVHRNSIEIFRGRRPSVYSEEPSDELCVLGVSSEFCFLGIPSEISDGIPRKYEFPRRYFRRLVSSRGQTRRGTIYGLGNLQYKNKCPSESVPASLKRGINMEMRVSGLETLTQEIKSDVNALKTDFNEGTAQTQSTLNMILQLLQPQASAAQANQSQHHSPSHSAAPTHGQAQPEGHGQAPTPPHDQPQAPGDAQPQHLITTTNLALDRWCNELGL